MPLRVLHLEDDPRDAQLVQDLLEVERIACTIQAVRDHVAFETALSSGPHDLIFVDYNVSGYDGATAIRRAQERQPDTPVIVISGSLGEEEAIRCLQLGATDYLLKQRLGRLAAAVKRALHDAEQRRQQKHAEQTLRERERRLSSIYEAVSDALFYIDVEEEGRYRFASVNQGFLATTGYDRSDVVGRRVEQVVPASSLPRTLDRYAEAVRTNRVVRWEDTSSYPRGTVTCEVSVVPVVDDAGKCAHLAGAAHDITERRHLEAQFRHAQKMEAVGQLAGGIAHDFNNLLTVITGTAAMALQELTPASSMYEDLQEIRLAGEMAATLTRQLLAFSRKQILQPEVLNLNTVLAEVGPMLQRLIGEDVELVLVPRDGLGNVRADAGQIGQVLANLTVNARDAMPRGGQLTIETQNADLDDQYARQHGVSMVPGAYVMLAISDTGAGMDEATRSRIFEPFFTTKEAGKGTGLGLSTVYGIVKQSGGFIWVYTEPDRGTSFKIYLPRVAEGRHQARPVQAALQTQGRETILLVEDMDGLRFLTKRMLESAGYTVLAAEGGHEALETLDRYEHPVPLMITDVVMPAMSGQELAARIEQSHPATRVLFMSGYTDDAVVRHGVLDARMHFLNKPFAVDSLLRKVREVLDS